MGQHVICGLKKMWAAKNVCAEKNIWSQLCGLKIVWAAILKNIKTKMNNGPASNGPKNICGP